MAKSATPSASVGGTEYTEAYDDDEEDDDDDDDDDEDDDDDIPFGGVSEGTRCCNHRHDYGHKHQHVSIISVSSMLCPRTV